MALLSATLGDLHLEREPACCAAAISTLSGNQVTRNQRGLPSQCSPKPAPSDAEER